MIGALALLALGASGAAGEKPRPAIEVTASDFDLALPESTTPGAATFEVVTTDPKSGNIGLARLRPGRTEQEFRTHLRRVFEGEGQEVIDASRDLMATAELLGGGIAQIGQPVSFTQRLRHGSYLVYDYLDFEGASGHNPPPGRERVRTLTVEGKPNGRTPKASAVIEARDVPDVGPRFLIDGTVRVGEPLRFVNAMEGQVDEAVFYRIEDDAVTDDDIQRYFEAVADGDWTAEPPFDSGSQLGTPPLSPGRATVVQLPLEPGRYALVTWVRSIDDARPLAAKGQHAIVEVG